MLLSALKDKGSKKYDRFYVIDFNFAKDFLKWSFFPSFMGLWNDYVVICIKMYNFKGSKKYYRFYVI